MATDANNPPNLPGQKFSDCAIFYSNDAAQQKGPVTLHELQDLARKGMVKSSVLVWFKGIEDWTPADEIPGFYLPECEEPPPLPFHSKPAVPKRQSNLAEEVSFWRPMHPADREPIQQEQSHPPQYALHVHPAREEGILPGRMSEVRVQHYDRSSGGRKVQVMGWIFLLVALVAFIFSQQQSMTRDEQEFLGVVAACTAALGLINLIVGTIYVFIYHRD